MGSFGEQTSRAGSAASQRVLSSPQGTTLGLCFSMCIPPHAEHIATRVAQQKNEVALSAPI